MTLRTVSFSSEKNEYNQYLVDYDAKKPTDHKDGTGDGSSIYIDFDKAKEESLENSHATVGIIIDHEVSHAAAIDKGEAGQTAKEEENRAISETNEIREEKNRTRINKIKQRELYE